MGLSSNSLIHFTQEKESLIGILKEEFKIKYCQENVITPNGNLNYSIPMVSFCDIPMSEIKEHIKKYGAYGIGLKREWGQSNNLNPVLYIDKNSSLGAGYHNAFYDLFRDKKITNLTETEANLANTVRYMKNYEADLNRNGIIITNYRFADEKEWRFVPDKDKAQMVVKGSIMADLVKEKMNNSISELRLSFEPKDIKYIIINDETEISEFIDVLRRAKGKKYTLEDVERLMTRIITTEQILTDF